MCMRERGERESYNVACKVLTHTHIQLTHLLTGGPPLLLLGECDLDCRLRREGGGDLE